MRVAHLARLVMLGGAVVVAACSSAGASNDGCVPAPGSCDLPSPSMRLIDESLGCLEAPARITDVCATSVNRCYVSGGFTLVCAFAPDGRALLVAGNDSETLTAAGWRFEQYVAGPAPPSDQLATGAEAELCARVSCWPACVGTPEHFGLGCPQDAGADDAADAGE